MDHYDEQHQETGSGNISKASQEWQEVLAEARRINDGSEPVLHTAYRLANARPEDWAKCANCGSPYQLTPEWGDGTVCSEACVADYVSYLNDVRF